MTDEQNQMKREYNMMRDGFTYKMKLKKAGEEGLLLFVKYGLVVILAWFALTFVNNLIAGSQNGTTAVMYINEAIAKGHLPKAVNGSIPQKEAEGEKTTSNNASVVK